MAHHVAKSGYQQLTERLNRFPQGAPPSETLYKILGMLFSEREAELVSLLPIKPFTIEKAQALWKMEREPAQKILDELSSRAILLDIEANGERTYTLPPPMAGFFEFSLMRIRGDIDQKALAELYRQYLNVEEDFIRSLFVNGETQLGRTFVQEPALSEANCLHVLDYERASEVAKTASYIGIGICYCRHKMQHLGQACDAPMEICMTFNGTAQSLIKYKYARQVEVAECLDKLSEAYENNLVQFGENAREEVSFICNCCGCCCEAMNAARKFGLLNPVHTTNFIPVIDQTLCNGCGKCVNICPVEAMTLAAANNSGEPARRKARVNEDVCLGCGVCVRNCPKHAIRLESRPSRVITPVNSVHRVVMMAIERGDLQNLIFDQQALANHRAMAAILGVILKLPPIKQVMASRQFKSQYLETLLSRYNAASHH
jgi:Pyruvate/2-oxoacid:ferredoxin oxidoreductase delta subunit